jgi:galactokinase
MVSKEWMKAYFLQQFNRTPRVFQAPGRINLIGEHTDYNGGFVMPAGIDLACYVALALSDTEESTMMAYDLDESIMLSEIFSSPVKGHWSNYVYGVLRVFESRGFKIPPFNMVLRSEVPIGAGLSSSAALESAVATAFNECFQFGLGRMELALIAQEAENRFVGVQCGIMDMFASIHAKKNQAIQLDCRSMAFRYVPLELGENVILLLDTCLKHDLASSEYNKRRQECEAVVALMQTKGHQAESLRDIQLFELKSVQSELDPVNFRRAKYVIEENIRVEQFAAAMHNRDWSKAGAMMYATHQGLKDDYEVSCPELDFLVDAIRGMQGVWGSRMMGGGFGGCTINIVSKQNMDAILEKAVDSYRQVYGIAPKSYIATTGDGACEL